MVSGAAMAAKPVSIAPLGVKRMTVHTFGERVTPTTTWPVDWRAAPLMVEERFPV